MADPTVLDIPVETPPLIAGAVYHSEQDDMEEFAMCIAVRKISGRTYGYLQRVGWKPLELEEGSEESKQWTLHWAPSPARKRGRPRKVA